MTHFPALVADIGGTHARFAWVRDHSAAPDHATTLKVADFDTLLAASQHYLSQLSQTLGGHFQAPQEAAFAVAATVQGDSVCFTNSPWTFARAQLQSALGLKRMLVLNDFEALAYALPHLASSQLRFWSGQSLSASGNLAVLGPGTGLGVAALVKTPSAWLAVPAEGGHATLASGNDFEAEVLRQVRQAYGHVSAERLLSGLGLPLLHQTVLKVRGLASSDVSTERLISAGLADDLLARETLSLFCAWLGAFAGNVALTLGAQGGLYIGGGIVPRLGDFFFESSFRERFEAKGRFSAYLAEIPVAVILDSHAALLGATYRLTLED